MNFNDAINLIEDKNKDWEVIRDKLNNKFSNGDWTSKESKDLWRIAKKIPSDLGPKGIEAVKNTPIKDRIKIDNYGKDEIHCHINFHGAMKDQGEFEKEIVKQIGKNNIIDYDWNGDRTLYLIVKPNTL